MACRPTKQPLEQSRRGGGKGEELGVSCSVWKGGGRENESLAWKQLCVSQWWRESFRKRGPRLCWCYKALR